MSKDTIMEKVIPEDEKHNKKAHMRPWCCSVRFSVAILGFMGFLTMNAQRASMGVTLVCMVNQSSYLDTSIGKGNDSGVEVDPQCSIAQINASEPVREGEFNWDKPTQGLILAAFFWGYMISQIPGGWLADRYGGSKIFGINILLMSCATILSPIASRFDYRCLIVLRFIGGLGAGVSYPAMHALWGKWAPPLERSRLAGLCYAGSQLGNVISMPIAGVLCEHGFDGGWPATFYVLGGAGCLWCILWLALVGDTPASDKRISSSERDYIITSLSGQSDSHTEKFSIPWKSILTSTAVWAIIVANLTGDFGLYTFETSMPSYLRDVLKFDITANGFLSALPYVVYWLSIMGSGVLADFLRSKGYLSTAKTRKLMDFIGKFTKVVMLIALSFMDCTQRPAAIAMLVIGVGISGFEFSGYLVNHVDIAPQYAGVLMGLSNCIACLSGVGGPYLVGVITRDSTHFQWQMVFFLVAGISLLGCIFFLIFARGSVLPWAHVDENLDHEKEEAQQMMLANGTANGVLPSNGTAKKDSLVNDDKV